MVLILYRGLGGGQNGSKVKNFRGILDPIVIDLGVDFARIDMFPNS